MDPIVDLQVAKKQVLQEANEFLDSVREIVTGEPGSVQNPLSIMQRLRTRAYENLNQIQHKAMIIRAALFLEMNDLRNKDVDWYWHPKQTGGLEEPDLRGEVAGEVIISAEVTTSEKPQGIIDSKMQSTLEKLDTMPGEKFYFVQTEPMLKRANNKVRKANFPIEVRLI